MMTSLMIGQKIAEARKKMNISQAQLAQQLFVSSQAVGKWERGESMPDIITFNRMTKIMDIDLNYFSECAKPESKETSFEQIKPTKLSNDVISNGLKKKTNWDMSRGNWLDADFSGLKNLYEKFSDSNMQRCQFIRSDLSGLHLKSNNIDHCDFSNSEISNSHIQRSNIANNLFKDCFLKETEFLESYIMGNDFSGADFSGASFKLGGFQNNLIVNSVLNRTSFNAMHIANIVFEGALMDCYFENCVYSKVTFQNATLTNTFFKNKSLKRIRFIECKVDRLTYAFLKNGKADLSGITLLV